METQTNQRIRKFIGIIYAIGIFLSPFMIFDALLTFGQEGVVWARYGLVISSLFFAIALVASILLNKKSLYLFLLPMLLAGCYFFFSNTIENYHKNRDVEFCHQVRLEPVNTPMHESSIRACEGLE